MGFDFDAYTLLQNKYNGPIPAEEQKKLDLPDTLRQRKWKNFWRGEVYHAIWALRRKRTARYHNRTQKEFLAWRQDIIDATKRLKTAMRHYRNSRKKSTAGHA